MYDVIKRDGSTVEFNLSKIENAIKKAFDAVGKEYIDAVIETIALRVTADFSSKVKDGHIHVEDIQDSVERVLGETGYGDVAKAYILYRENHAKIRDVKGTVLDYKKLVDDYIGNNDWRVKENSTVNYSIGGLILSNSGAVTANYWLSQVYDKEIADAHKNADIHIHDLSFLGGYCAGWNLKQLIKEGLGGIMGKITSAPAKHLSTLTNQMVNFIGCFTDDTKVVMADGSRMTFGEMMDCGKESFDIISYNNKTNEIVKTTMNNVHKTRTVDELIRLTMENDDVITCTLDHKFYTDNRGWVEAKDLERSDCIITADRIIYVSVVHKEIISEHTDVFCGSVNTDRGNLPAFFVNSGILVHNCLQNEWAGAQAFSSFDTYLAPFVKADNLSYKEVKQAIQSLVYGLNTSSRWGCVPETYKVMTTEGWKGIDELKEGDILYTWKDGRLSKARNNKVIIKEHHGKLLSFRNPHYGYEQTVTGYHRTLVSKSNCKVEDAIIMQADDIRNSRCANWKLPTSFPFGGINDKGIDLSDNEIRLAAMIYTDGSVICQNDKLKWITYTKSLRRYPKTGTCDVFESLGLNNVPNIKISRLSGKPVFTWSFYGEQAKYIYNLIGGTKKRIDDKFLSMNEHQARIFLETWIAHDGDREKMKAQCDNRTIMEQIAFINVLAGHCSSMKERPLKSGNHVNYVKTNQVSGVAFDIAEEDYDGRVWCPNNEDGTAVFMNDKGGVFISGQCQSPFSNITLDWVCPDDQKNLPAIVGGKEMPFTYGDCQKEMDMINKAFIEIMIEGDAEGRGFQYPIPTYSITKDFDWDPKKENNRLLFEMTAKYGTPYFSNYINSDMNPSDCRSMCPVAACEQVLVYDDYVKEFHVSNIKSLWRSQEEKHAKRKTYILFNGELKEAKLNKFEVDQMYEVELMNGHKIKISDNHTNLTLGGLKRTDELRTDDYLPFNIIPFKDGKGLTYNDGFIIGAYLGDGSKRDTRTITLSLNMTSKKGVLEKIKALVEGMGAKTTITKTDGIGSEGSTLLNITSLYVKGLIEEFVVGNNALEKALNLRALGKSEEFRRGIVDGMYATDGGNRNRIYSASKAMIDSLAALFTSLGIVTRVDVDNRTGITGKLSDNPTYCIRFYEENGIPCRKDVYIKEKGYMWFRIKSIKKIPGNLAFCFEVLNDEKPYFVMPNGLVTHNCRLRLDLRELRKKGGGYFGSGESTGSVGVVTINLPRIAYLSKDKEDFYQRLDRIMDISARSLNIKRNVVTKLMDQGLYPYTKRYLGTLNNHFSTIGLVGMNEACLNAKWLECSLGGKKAQDFAIEVLNHMRTRLSDYQEKYGDLYNLEATPAESCSYRLAKHDKEKYPDIITASSNEDAPYYTNSTHLPVGYTDDIFQALDIEDPMQVLYTSGTVFHAFLGEKMPNWESAMSLVRTIAENYRLPYFTLSPTYSVCPDHGYISGEVYKCPVCGKPTEVYSRITGYYRPVQNWNVGKAEEFRERKTYDVPNSKLTHSGPLDGVQAAETPVMTTKKADELLLFTTKTCPNCRIAKAALEKSGKAYTVIDAEENADLCRQYGVMQAPTLVVLHDGSATVIANASNIRAYAEQH